ncbi:MAG TPA: DNA polymerase III subunit beta [Candidatus Binataceae bacterium]|nr:DNA polymerase III subunit beta [Candidatus Binataceae bacterium]
MELSIDRTSLLNGLSLVQGIVERRNTVPILGHVMIEAEGGSLNLSATDLEVGIRTALACRSNGGGTITLNARKIFEIVREAGGEDVNLKSLENDWVELKCGRARFKMMGLDPRSFPAMPHKGEPKAAAGKAVKAEISLGPAVLATMIDKTIFAVSPDEARYNLTGVFIESPTAGSARMVATDGHRLAMIEREVAGFSMQGGVIIPRKGLIELRRMLDRSEDGDVNLQIDNQIAYIKRGSTEVSMRLVEGEFPDYKGVIPKQSRYHIGVERDILMAAIKRAAIFSNERYHGVKFGVSEGTLTVSSTSPEMGEASETIDIDFKGEEFSIGFNATYLIQVLGVIESGTDAVLGLTDEVSPGVITTPADSQFTYVVMPMRL